MLGERFLQIPDHWETFAAAYLDALDVVAGSDAATAKRGYRSRVELRAGRADSLADWHQLLLRELQDEEGLAILEQLATHEGLAGPERTYLEAELAHRQGDAPRARELIRRCIDKRPGDQEFRDAARRFEA